MSVSMLFSAMVFTGKGLERTVRWLLTANGLLLPSIALQMRVHWFIWIAATGSPFQYLGIITIIQQVKVGWRGKGMQNSPLH